MKEKMIVFMSFDCSIDVYALEWLFTTLLGNADQITSEFSNKNKKLHECLVENEKQMSQGIRIYESYYSKETNDKIALCYDEYSKAVRLIVTVGYNQDIEKVIDIFAENNHIYAAYLQSEIDYLRNNCTRINAMKRVRDDVDSLITITLPQAPFGKRIDITKLSGHFDECGNIVFGSSFKMWFGIDFFRFISQEVLQRYSECCTTEILKNGTIKIQLYENTIDYQSELANNRKWEFRKFTHMDKVVEDWRSEYKSIAAADHSSANMEILTGVFPNGGVRQVRMYLDKDGQNATKKNASKYVYKEYDSSGKVIAEGECDTESD